MLSMALNYIKMLFMMLFIFDIGASYLHYLHYVFVVNPSQLIMLHMELSALFVIKKSEIFLLMEWVLSQFYSPSPVNHYAIIILLLSRIMLI